LDAFQLTQNSISTEIFARALGLLASQQSPRDELLLGTPTLDMLGDA